jgi:hypothetical protein
MAVAYDNATAIGTGTGEIKGKHAPVGTPAFAIVYVEQGSTSTGDEVTGVTYGGEVMERKHTIAGGETEIGRSYAYFLSKPPAGEQEVVVKVSAATTRAVVCFTGTSTTGEGHVVAANGVQGHNVSYNFNLETPVGVETFISLGLFSGNSANNTTPGTGYTEMFKNDQASFCFDFGRRTANGTGGTILVEWGGADDCASSGLAVADGPPPQVLVPDKDEATTGWTETPLYTKLADTEDSTVVKATLA